MIHTCFEFAENISRKRASKQNIIGDPYLNGRI